MRVAWRDQIDDEARLARTGRFAWWLLSWSVTLIVVAAMVGVIGLVTVPKALGWKSLIVLSGSMEPTLATGSVAFVEPASPDEIGVGDVITYRRQNDAKVLVTHRVIGIEGEGSERRFETQGDANAAPDSETVSRQQFVGHVRYYAPYIGNIVDALHDRTNYYLFLGIPAGLLILNEIVGITGEVRKARRQNVPEQSGFIEGAYS